MEEKLELEPLELEPIESNESLQLEPLELESIEKSEPINPLAVGTATGLGVEAVRRGIESSAPLAEDLAFRAIGGNSTSQGVDLIKQQAENQFVDSLVNPRSVGRQVLDENLLPNFGLGSKEQSLANATKSLMESSKPTNELLSEINQPISKEAIYARTGELLDVNNLDPAVPENKLIKKNYVKRLEDLLGSQSPLEAEETKRQLQKSINYGSDKGAAKATVSKAQARATREAVEDIMKKEGLLDTFKQLKSKSGNLATAKDIIDSSIKPTGSTIEGLASTLSRFATEKIPGVGAKAIDLASNIASSKAAKLAGPLAGLAAGGLALNENLKDENLSTPEAFGLATAEAVNPIPFTDVRGGYKAGKEEFKQTNSIPKAIAAGSKEFAKPLVEQYDQGQEITDRALEAERKAYASSGISNETAKERIAKTFSDFDNIQKKVPFKLSLEEANKLLQKLDTVKSPATESVKPIIRDLASGDPSAQGKADFLLQQDPRLKSAIEKMK